MGPNFTEQSVIFFQWEIISECPFIKHLKVFFEEARRKEEGRINCATPRLTFPSESVPPQGFQRSCFKQGPKKRSHSWILDANPDPTYRTAGGLLPAEFSTLSRPGLLRTTPQVASSSQRTEPLSALSFLSPGTAVPSRSSTKVCSCHQRLPVSNVWIYIVSLRNSSLHSWGNTGTAQTVVRALDALLREVLGLFQAHPRHCQIQWEFLFLSLGKINKAR